MNIGDHLVTPRTGYTHHGLYIGNGEVIHYSGFANGQSTGTICITSVKAFANGHDVSVKEHFFRFHDREKSVERAHNRLGEDWYNVLINNCEHFVNWCINGLHNSEQVNNMIAAISVVYNAANESKQIPKTAQALAGVVAGRAVQKEVERQVTQAVVKSVVSKSAGIAAGTGMATTGAGAATTALLSSSIMASIPAAPVLAPLIVAVGVGYVVSEVFDWFWD
jgi:Lecithin retinol acyltransferase